MKLQREIKRNLNKYGKFLEPFMILALVGIFVLPILSVKNLSPETGSAPSGTNNVLGVQSDEPVEVNNVGGIHNYIQNEKLIEISKSSYEYYANVLIRDAGIYNKPVLEVSNPSSATQQVEVLLLEYETSATQIGILVDKTNYVLKDSDGDINVRILEVEPAETITLYLDIRNEVPVNFHEKVGFRINILKSEVQLDINPSDPTTSEIEVNLQN